MSIYVDNILLVTDTSLSYSTNWNVRKVTPGLYTIKAIVVDNSNNMSQDSVIVTVN